MEVMRASMVLALAAACGLAGCTTYETYETYPDPVTREQLIAMVKARVPDSAIVEQIERQGLASRPTADDLVALKNAGASDGLLQAAVSAPVNEEHVLIRHHHYDWCEPHECCHDDLMEPLFFFGLGYLVGRH